MSKILLFLHRFFHTSSRILGWLKFHPKNLDIRTFTATLVKMILSLLLELINFYVLLLIYIHKKIITNILKFERFKNWVKKWLMWRRGLLFRPATHGGVVVLTIIVIISGSIFGRNEIAAQSISPTEEGLLITGTTTETIIPANRVRLEIINHTVSSGETLSSIGKKYDLNVESTQWLNNLTDINDLQPGQVLRIPPLNGVVHKVKQGDSIDTVAKKYQASTQAIADYPGNFLDDTFALRINQELIVPDGVLPQTPKPKPTAPPALAQGGVSKSGKVSASGRFLWPTSGSTSQHFSWFHPGEDIHSFASPPIQSSDSGTVVLVQYLKWSYGHHVIIDHGNGYQTLYAHLSRIYVGPGERVVRGQAIGQMGSTGRSTGPHLHFEIRKNGTPVNPLSYF